MVLNQEDIDKIVKFVRKEPCTVQDVSKLINRAWATTDLYLQQIKERTGLINIKTFRKGSHGALKVVYYNHSGTLVSGDLREKLYNQIKNARMKTDFDFFEIFQFIPDDKKNVFTEEIKDENVSVSQKFVPFLRQTEDTLMVFSGNLSFLNLKEKGKLIADVFEELVKRKVRIKILCRVNLASLNNISKIADILKKYPEFVEIRHSFQPLRGYLVDDKVGRFKSEEVMKNYRKAELHKNVKIFYEFYDEKWLSWLQNVFWGLWRTSIEYSSRARQLEMIF